MVIPRIICLILLLTASLAAQDVKVAVDLNQGPIGENQPIKGTISITHVSTEKIEPNSFILGKEPLSAEFVREVKLVGDYVLTLYRFESKGSTKGLYVLPSVSVNVGGQTFRSPLTSYEVQGNGRNGNGNYAPATTPTPPPVNGGPTSSQTISNLPGSLKLEAFVEGENKIYPGQRTRLAYRITYTGNIELKEEVLPLLKPDGLRKIGDLETKEDQQGDNSILLIYQLVEGLQPGSFTYGPSYVEGLTYQESPGGRKIYANAPLHSEVPPLTLEVLPFPVEVKPASFKGAIGPLQMDVTLSSPASVSVGDKITLTVNFTSDGLLDNLSPPDVCCQPGFNGLFKASDLPPQSTIKGKTKTFIFDLWPLSTEIKAIPPLEYSYFDPQTAKYVTLKSEPIPLKVISAKQPEQLHKDEDSQPEKPEKALEPIPTAPIEIQSIYPLDCADLHNNWFGTWNVFALVPLGAALLMMQTALRDAINRRKRRVKVKTSEDFLAEANAAAENPKEFYPLLNKTLIAWLNETHEIETSSYLPEELPTTGLPGKVRSFLMTIQENRFSGKDNLQPKELLKQARDIMRNSGGEIS